MNDAYETESWMLTIGAAPGGHPLISEEELSQIYTDCDLKIFDETDVPIPVSIWKKKEVVRDENGRPVSGTPAMRCAGHGIRSSPEKKRTAPPCFGSSRSSARRWDRKPSFSRYSRRP